MTTTLTRAAHARALPQQPTPQDADVSIRRRALDLLFSCCSASTAELVVDELLRYAVVADLGLREELVLKVAILAEKFAPSVQWWVLWGRLSAFRCCRGWCWDKEGLCVVQKRQHHHHHNLVHHRLHRHGCKQ